MNVERPSAEKSDNFIIKKVSFLKDCLVYTFSLEAAAVCLAPTDDTANEYPYTPQLISNKTAVTALATVITAAKAVAFIQNEQTRTALALYEGVVFACAFAARYANLFKDLHLNP